jgi:hypothetical protein
MKRQTIKPTLEEVYSLLRDLKPTIGDDYRASEDPEDDKPGMCVTVGSDGESWSYQTGDNSFTGGAYGFSCWGVGYLYRNSNCREVARHIIDELADSLFQEEEYREEKKRQKEIAK